MSIVIITIITNIWLVPAFVSLVLPRFGSFWLSFQIGTIQGSFGKSGKYKISFPNGIPLDAANRRITMHFKRFVFDKTKKMIQT
jgi:hypothetical protein